MNPTALLSNLLAAGVVVDIASDDPDALDVAGPRDALTADRLAALREHKPALLAILRGAMTPATWARRAAARLARVDDVVRRIALRDAFEERAAICEHDAGLSLDEAERMAFEELTEALGG